jgi:cob(I)alamin adenosyltransferase
VVNDKISLTNDEKEFKSTYNQELNAMMNIQAAGSDYYSGKVKKSKKQLNRIKNELHDEMKGLSIHNRKNFTKSIEYIDDELEEIQKEEETIKQRNVPKASYMATKGQFRSRMSRELKESLMKKKKKKKE